MYVTPATTKIGRRWPRTAPRRVPGTISLSPLSERWLGPVGIGYRHTVSALCPPPTASCDTLCAPPTAFCASHLQVDFNQFLSFLMNTSFTACAHGGGVDPAPKAFEALAAGSIPIIASSALDAAYQTSSRTRVAPLSLARTDRVRCRHISGQLRLHTQVPQAARRSYRLMGRPECAHRRQA